MRRKDVGRDFGLSVRMALALAVIAAIYLGGEALLILGTASSLADGDGWGFLAFLFFAALIPFVAIEHVRRSGSIALRRTRARVIPVDHERALQALLERVAAQASLPQPRLAIVDAVTPNAFAVGTTAGQSVITVTRGLIGELSEKEIEAVFAHELAHISNRDTAVMTFASGPATAGSGLWREADRMEKASYLMFSPAWAPIYALSILLMWSISRYREYVADRGSALLTGAPEQLMSALAKIGGETPKGDLRGGTAVSALCIVSTRPKRRLELFMDHPPLEKRLNRLAELAREMGRPVR